MSIICKFIEQHSDIKQLKRDINRALYIRGNVTEEIMIIEFGNDYDSRKTFIFKYDMGLLENAKTERHINTLDCYYNAIRVGTVFKNFEYMELKTF